jgi:hypothetical protein
LNQYIESNSLIGVVFDEISNGVSYILTPLLFRIFLYKNLIMKKIQIQIISVLLIVLWSCTSTTNNNKTIEEFRIDISKVKKLDKFYPTISAYEFITLQEDSLIKLGEINKIIFYNDNIYISDARKAKGVFIYNKEGALLSTINRLGHGIGEYTNIGDFDIDKSTNNIYILDPQLRKILIYDKKGIFLRDIKLDFIAKSFIITDKYLVFDKFNMMERDKNEVINNNLLICDRKGKILNGFLPIDKDLSSYSMGALNGLKENINGTISYLPPLSSHIYNYDISQGKMVNQLQIDFGNEWPSKSFFKGKQHPSRIVKLMKEKNLINFLNYSENDNFICLEFLHGTNKIIGYISKNDHSYNLYNANEATFESLPLSTDGNGNFVNVIYSELIENWEQFNLSVPENIKNNKSIVLFKYSFK